MERWYYFVRDGQRMVLKKRTMNTMRPDDANPDNGDPLTPWYETTNHFDDHHVHVRAASDTEAIRVAQGLISQAGAPSK